MSDTKHYMRNVNIVNDKWPYYNEMWLPPPEAVVELISADYTLSSVHHYHLIVHRDSFFVRVGGFLDPYKVR